MTFRLRSGEVVPPAERPWKRRAGARIVVRTPERVLLLRDTDPGLPGLYWWVTPGGGIDEGETPAEAAVRELAEETGLRVEVTDLIGPIANRTVTHGYSDQVIVQDETFYAVNVPETFEVDHAGFTEREKLGITKSGWFTLAELEEMWVWPDALPELFAADASSCIDLGEIEESTVAID